MLLVLHKHRFLASFSFSILRVEILFNLRQIWELFLELLFAGFDFIVQSHAERSTHLEFELGVDANEA